MPPEKADLYLICACGRKLCEAFDKLSGRVFRRGRFFAQKTTIIGGVIFGYISYDANRWLYLPDHTGKAVRR
jgi:hypothetical protein